MPTYSVTIVNDGNIFASYPSGRWTIVLTKGDGTTVTASTFTTYSDIVSMQITGLIYQHDADGTHIAYGKEVDAKEGGCQRAARCNHLQFELDIGCEGNHEGDSWMLQQEHDGSHGRWN